MNHYDKYALIDDEDYELIRPYQWRYHPKKNYAMTKIDGRTVLMHRLIMDAPDGIQVDHINHDRMDNTRNNLRLCTNAQNQYNTKPQKDRESKYKGVTRTPSGKWQARIGYEGTQYYLGSYNTEEQAALVYNNAALKLHVEFACINIS